MDIPSNAEILALLAALDQKTADDLESEFLDFKPWRDAKESVPGQHYLFERAQASA